ncbi:MAG TPA: type III secretion system chaperone [Chlamydiales bacterium]|jgi:hypothetical protein|nr:type III secretion system chaperone [Chlamydiales bacterium]
MLRDFVAQLSIEMEIDPIPKMNELKFIPFPVTDALEVEIRDLDPGISLHAKICPCPAKRLEDLFLRLMRANYLGQETAQNRIGLSADEKFLTLSLGMPYEISYRIFREMFEDFVNFIFYWREEIDKFIKQETLL